jgi:hypothetical protein
MVKMKNLIFLLITIFSLTSCKRDDNEISNKIFGEWKLMQAKQYGINASGEYELFTTDYSSQNIIYNFLPNNTLKVSGGENIGYNDGTYPYQFKNDYLGIPLGNESKVDLVEIQGIKWSFNLSNSQMTLDHSYVDGPALIFKRK